MRFWFIKNIFRFALSKFNEYDGANIGWGTETAPPPVFGKEK